MSRYALYYAPPSDSLLWTAGVHWLGRDPETGEAVAPPPVQGLAAERQIRLTDAARRYGWHATLKAPFALGAGLSRENLMTQLERFCARRGTVPLPTLKVGTVDGFLALIPSQRSEVLQKLAVDCVEFFDPLRAPPSPADRARREPAALSDRQRAYLDRWGYPYVLDEFRFHLTLTAPLAAPDRAALRPWLERWFAEALARPAAVDGLALFEEPGPGAPFRLIRRVAFAAG
jgi:putative phosphonate metabolism protein